ncbi:MAG: MotA/TolQ/ExbB proton channel family protein [Bdellovibrionales bacterium]|nr:MotA/TolQ/ExbB proton channel family protein [Bdellovibrionales bacterium]
MNVVHLITQGGPVMIVLLLFSITGLAIIILKALQFWRIGLRNTDFIDGAISALQDGNQEQALSLLEKNENPVARVLSTTIKACLSPQLYQADVEAEVRRVGSNEIRELESWLRGLSAIAHLSPLLGLLGTVLGMISAFMDLEGATSQINPALLAGGIWEALLTTAFGLTVAIPAMAAYYFLEGVVDQTRAIMKDATIRVLVLFNHRVLDHTQDSASSALGA